MVIIDPFWDYVIGIALSIISAIMFTFGAIFQKKGDEEIHKLGVEIKLSDMKSLITMAKNKYWIFGTVLGTLGGLPYLLSQSFIGITLTQPLQGAGLLVLIFAAVYYLKESLKRGEILAIFILIIGPIFLALSAVEPIDYDVVSYLNPMFIISLIIFYVICFSGIITTWIFFKKGYNVSISLALNSGFFFGMGAISSQVGMFFLELNIGFISILGIIFGFGMLIAGNALATVIVQIAFQKGKAVNIIPVQATLNYLLPIIGGIVIFLQIVNFWIFFIIGVGCQLSGSFLIARLQARMQKPIEKDIPKPDTVATDTLSGPTD